MSLHYNAFISYKHAPLDNKVAAEIEKQLERYHIPTKIQKKTGVKKIERIFRDKDELPITSDLTDTINEALYNSDFLIVLCSKSTHLSTWVEREIRLFLQTHPLDHVLTVLAEGEPYEVIPPILLNRQVQRYNSAGQVETVIEPVEPLSCDWRLPRKEAINTELPRLAAALIGCSYNELMNRQRQYKMRRLSAIAAGVMGLSIGFGGYMLYSNQRINENYQQSLINQSRYLANASEQLLEQEQRIDALHLALEALPNEKNPDRPVIPEAVRAINKASLAYVTQSGSNITAVWNYTMPDTIEKYEISFDGSSFAAIDQSHNVKVWNTENHQLMFQYNSATEVAGTIAYIGDNELLVLGSDFLRVVNVQTASYIWEKKAPEGVSFMTSERTRIPRLDDGTFLLESYRDGVFKYNILTGELEKNYKIPVEDALLYSSKKMSDICLSPDQTKMAFLSELGENDEKHLVVLDMVSQTYYSYNLEGADIYGEDSMIGYLSWIDDAIYVSCVKDVWDNSYGALGMQVIADSHIGIYCFNSKDLSIRWTNDFVYNAINYGSNFLDLPNDNAVMFYCGNICEIWDKQTGESLHRYDTNDSIVNVLYKKNDGDFSLLTHGGAMANVYKKGDTESLTAMYYFAGNLQKLIVNKGVYAHSKNSRDIVYYGVNVYDENFMGFEDAPNINSLYSYVMDEDTIAIVDDNEDETETFVDLFDAASKKYLGRVVLGTDSVYDYDIIGIENGVLYIGHDASSDGFKLCRVDIASMSVSETDLVDGYYASTKGDPVIADGKLIFYDGSQYDHEVVVYYDLATSQRQEFQVEQEYDGFACYFEFDPESKLIYYAGKYDYILNTVNGEIKEIPRSKNWNGSKRVYIDNDKQRILTTDNSAVLIRDLNGEEISSIVCPDLDVLGFTIYTPNAPGEKSQVLVVYSDGFLYRYDLESCEYIAKSELTYSSSAKEMTFRFAKEKGLLYIKGGNVLDIVDIDSWIELSYITSAMGYHEETDSFVVYSYDTTFKYKIGYYKQYTLEELIKRANDMLEGSEMSDDFKNIYGIG